MMKLHEMGFITKWNVKMDYPSVGPSVRRSVGPFMCAIAVESRCAARECVRVRGRMHQRVSENVVAREPTQISLRTNNILNRSRTVVGLFIRSLVLHLNLSNKNWLLRTSSWQFAFSLGFFLYFPFTRLFPIGVVVIVVPLFFSHFQFRKFFIFHIFFRFVFF